MISGRDAGALLSQNRAGGRGLRALRDRELAAFAAARPARPRRARRRRRPAAHVGIEHPHLLHALSDRRGLPRGRPHRPLAARERPALANCGPPRYAFGPRASGGNLPAPRTAPGRPPLAAGRGRGPSQRHADSPQRRGLAGRRGPRDAVRGRADDLGHERAGRRCQRCRPQRGRARSGVFLWRRIWFSPSSRPSWSSCP